MLPKIVQRAILDTVTNLGQLSEDDVKTLDKYTRRGWLSKGRGGPFPKPKTVWAHPGYDFATARREKVLGMSKNGGSPEQESVVPCTVVPKKDMTFITCVIQAI